MNITKNLKMILLEKLDELLKRAFLFYELFYYNNYMVKSDKAVCFIVFTRCY